ncbi:MAG: hypothetical protein ABIO88_16070 [Burkholderiaceae bacterium]
MQKDTFTRRLGELNKAFEEISYVQRRIDVRTVDNFADGASWQKWSTSAQNLLLAIYGNAAPHYINYLDAYNKCLANHGRAQYVVSSVLGFVEQFLLRKLCITPFALSLSKCSSYKSTT